MAKSSPTLKVHDAAAPAPASAELVQQALREVIVTDPRGRQIKLTKPSPVMQFRLVKLLGDDAKNETYVSMVLPLMYVSAINNEPVGFPVSQREIEALIMRLDEDGIATVMKGVMDNFAAGTKEAAAEDLK